MQTDGGFIKIHRSIFRNDLAAVHSIPIAYFFFTLISDANYKDSKFYNSGKQQMLLRGQLRFNYRSTAKRMGVSTSTICRWLQYLKNTDRIRYTGDTRGTTITICNYSKYQDNMLEDGTQTKTPTKTPIETPAETPLLIKKEERRKNTKGDKKTSPDRAPLIAFYVELFQERYGPKARPDLSGKVQGLFKTFLKDHSLDRAKLLLKTYLKMEETWFLTKCHDFSTFMGNLQKIAVQADKGVYKRDLSYLDGK